MTLPEGIEDVLPFIQQLRDALHQIEASRTKSVCGIDLAVVEEHFRNLHSTLKKSFEELETREEEYREKEAKILVLLSEREASVTVKEQDLLDRIQELKDAAVASITQTQPSHQLASPEFIAVEDCKERKVSSLVDVISSSKEPPHNTGASLEGVASDVKPRPELIHFCKQMDAKGLLKFITENKKHVNAFREELPTALECATEPGQLVLDSLDCFYPPAETTQPAHSRTAQCFMRRSCVLLMEVMATLLARIDPGGQHLLNLEIKQQAKTIADQWKHKLTAATDATNVPIIEAHAFLQLLSTFKIASEFDDEELCKLLVVVARGRQTPELCRALGLTHKMPGVIESLVESGKQLDAVHLIQAFQLTEKFPPVPLLKAYLKDLRRNSQGKGGHSSGAPGVKGSANSQELVALKAIIKCIEGYKLEDEYPLEPLNRRLDQLERLCDKKRLADVGKHQQSKKSKPTGKYPRSHRGAAASERQTPPVFVDTAAYVGMPERYSRAAAISYDYQVLGLSANGRQTPPALNDRAAFAGLLERYTQAAPIPYDYKIPGQSASSRQTMHALIERPSSYADIPERYSQTAAIQYDYQVAGQSPYGQLAIDQQTYHYPQEDRVAPPSSYSEFAFLRQPFM